MERIRLRRSKVSSVTEGNRHTHKQRHCPKLAPDSSSCDSGTKEKDVFTYELAQRSAKQVTGTPIKKLLAEEMSKETEAKKQPTSVIAKLMGLDVLPPQRPFQKQPKGLSGNYQQGTPSVGFQRNDKHEGRSSRKSSMEQQEFKDVYEDLETLKREGGRYPAKGTASSKIAEAEFIRQKIIDAKHCCLDEKLQGSRDLCDTVERLDSNKDLFLRYLQQPDSLFTKHLLDICDAAPKSKCNHIAVIKPSNYEKYESNAIGWKLERDTSLKYDNSSRLKRRDGCLTHSCHKHGACNYHKSSKNQLEGTPETELLPARIVVLKPNLGKLQNTNKKHAENPSSGTGVSDSRVKKKSYSFMGYSGPISRESREIAREITRKMRETLGSDTINLPSITGGYAGDESSYNNSGSDSASESEVILLTSRDSLDWSGRQKLSSSHLLESSVSREAKKRLSERWKMTQRYQEVKMVGRGSTLGEMLAVPDSVIRTDNLYAKIVQDEPSERFASSDESGVWGSPLGISSRDGWKDGTRGLPRQHLSASSVGCGSPKTSKQRGAFDDDRYLMPKEAVNPGRKKAVNGNLKSINKKSQSSSHTCSDHTDSLQDDHFSQSETEVNVEKKDSPEQHPWVSDLSAGYVTYRSSITGAEHESMAMSSDSTVELLLTESTSMLEIGDSSTHDLEVSNAQGPSVEPSEESPVPLQCPIPEPESPASSKEADHPSPVSILEVPFTEDVLSGSECFERVSADLQGLRAQLKLLKMESQVDDEVTMLISSDADIDQELVAVSEENEIYTPESWESSYLVDVLDESGYNHADLDMFVESWDSRECPLGPWIFDNLEKYYSETTWSKSERRLLFERINLALSKIFQRFLDPTRSMGPKLQKDWIRNEVHKLLESQEKTLSEGVAELVLEGESRWLDLRDDVEVIGKEIEKLMIVDLITEVVTM